MDTIVQGPLDDGVQELNLVESAEWSNVPADLGNNNSGYVYIAVS